MTMIEPLATRWFGSVGAIKVIQSFEDEPHTIKYYIGYCPSHDEKVNTEYIVAFGDLLPNDVGEFLFKT